VLLTVLLPFQRGDLVDRAHREGEILEVEHLPEGTRLTLRAPHGLAAAVQPYATAATGDAAPAARAPSTRR